MIADSMRQRGAVLDAALDVHPEERCNCWPWRDLALEAFDLVDQAERGLTEIGVAVDRLNAIGEEALG